METKYLDQEELSQWLQMIEEEGLMPERREGFFLHRLLKNSLYSFLTQRLFCNTDLFDISDQEVIRYAWSHGPLSLIKECRSGELFTIGFEEAALGARLLILSGCATLQMNDEAPFKVEAGGFVHLPPLSGWKLRAETHCFILWKGHVIEETLGRYLEKKLIQNLPATIQQMRSYRPEFKKTLGIFWQ